MEWWTAYLLHYLKNIYGKSKDKSLPMEVRKKYLNAWKMIEQQHQGLCRSLKRKKFQFEKVIVLDWTEKLKRIATMDGAFE